MRLDDSDRGVTVGPTCGAAGRQKCGGERERRWRSFLAEMGARHARECAEHRDRLQRDNAHGRAIVAFAVAVPVIAFAFAALAVRP